MPRFFFDLQEGGRLRQDSEGSDLPDSVAARREAVETLLEIARDLVPAAGDCDLSLHVRDGSGTITLTATLSFRVISKPQP